MFVEGGADVIYSLFVVYGPQHLRSIGEVIAVCRCKIGVGAIVRGRRDPKYPVRGRRIEIKATLA